MNLQKRLLVSAVLLLSSCKVATSGFSSRIGGSSGSSGRGGSSSSRTIVIPDLFRMTKADAETALKRAGFEGTIDWDDQLCGSVVEGQIIETGQVCRQHPPAGREQPSRLPITILVQPEDPRHGRVGQFGEWHLMPNVVGMPLDKAKAAMRAAGFTEERTHIDARAEPGCQPNRVCRTYPEGLTRAGQSSDRYLIIGADPAAKPPAETNPPEQVTPETKPDSKPDAKPDSGSEPDPFF
jgi:beta-lactam-binding protein with PASTA domain